jgi:hypothetical protein
LRIVLDVMSQSRSNVKSKAQLTLILSRTLNPIAVDGGTMTLRLGVNRFRSASNGAGSTAFFQPDQVIPTALKVDPSCPHLLRASTSCFVMNIKGVDGRDKPGHDDGESHLQRPLVLPGRVRD